MSGRLVAVFALLIAAAVGGWLIFSDRGPAPRAPVDIPEKPAEARPEHPSPASQPLPRIRPRLPHDDEEPPAAPPPPAAGEAREAAPAVAFVVTNAAGTPIEKARVFTEGYTSAPTGPDGRASLTVAPSTKTVVAGAPGFRISRYPLPEPHPATVEIRLERSVTLVVRVRHEDPQVQLIGLAVVLSFDVEDAEIAFAASSVFDDVRGAKQTRYSSDGRHLSLTYAVSPGADLAVSGFDRGDEIEVAVQDRHRNVILQETIRLPVDDDTHAVEFVVRSKPRVIRGTVLDWQGQPLAGARVAASGSWIWAMAARSRTDASGKFELGDVYAADPAVSVVALGHVPATVTAPAAGDPLMIRLERGRQLQVTITGTDGMFRGEVIFEFGAGEARSPDRGAEHVFWFNGLPCRPGTLRVNAPGRKPAVLAVGPEETAVSVAVPE